MDPNLRTYNARDVVSWYSHHTGITPAENRVFERYQLLISEAHVLDIGVGSGRTTSYLIDKCRKYTGIDYSEAFVKFCRRKFPGADISQQDARNLSVMSDDTFDFVIFSFNGLDYVDLEGRNSILTEVHRVLAPGGVFFFSTHNKNGRTFNRVPWLNKEDTLTNRAKTFIKVAPFYFPKRLSRRMETMDCDYAIINDYAHQYRLMTFYTTAAFLRKQLLFHQFVNVTFYDSAGNAQKDEELDDSIIVTCRKAPLLADARAGR
jgi:SAM-dependent methyltransferase